MRKLNIAKNKTEKQNIESKSGKKLNLLGHIEKIVELSVDSKLSDEFFDKARPHINFVNRRLHLNDIQSVLLSHFIDRSADSCILIREIAETLKCRPIKILQHWTDIEILEKRKLIRCIRPKGNSLHFSVKHEVMDAFMQNKDFQIVQRKNINLEDFFDILDGLFDERDDNLLTYKLLTEEIITLLEDNPQLEFTKRLGQYSLGTDEKMLFLFFCHLFVANDDDNIRFHDFEDLFDNKSDFRHFKHMLADKCCDMMESGLVETTNNDGFEDRESFKLTDKAKNELLGELNIKANRAKHKKGLTPHTSIASKNLFYNEKEQRQVVELTALLQEENFCNVRKRLTEKGMRTGFACLFHGAPGTGKTETVYQIARSTGRDIMMVDISETKSMWFGESEKKIKEVFERYKTFVKQSEMAPILLFNEADAVINKRQEIGKSSVDKTENAIQNIILQEMENLEGIMIATTNLTQNLDKAFERRFLYKIEFGKPNMEAKKSIWQSIIPTLTAADATILANCYDFSGGQIENIARKCTVDNIISGSEPDLEKLEFHCKNELLTKGRQSIGFIQRKI
jgi:SpoVK/Ycf46/Vps4 family AAA+-type ATPase